MVGSTSSIVSIPVNRNILILMEMSNDYSSLVNSHSHVTPPWSHKGRPATVELVAANKVFWLQHRRFLKCSNIVLKSFFKYIWFMEMVNDCEDYLHTPSGVNLDCALTWNGQIRSLNGLRYFTMVLDDSRWLWRSNDDCVQLTVNNCVDYLTVFT